ncbi:MAG: hypothetical protein QF791_05980 [Nitrospinaceae bacterium]|nr:hypothetical protein [Nitrospinaceae bacterium]
MVDTYELPRNRLIIFGLLLCGVNWSTFICAGDGPSSGGAQVGVTFLCSVMLLPFLISITRIPKKIKKLRFAAAKGAAESQLLQRRVIAKIWSVIKISIIYSPGMYCSLWGSTYWTSGSGYWFFPNPFLAAYWFYASLYYFLPAYFLDITKLFLNTDTEQVIRPRTMVGARVRLILFFLALMGAAAWLNTT